MRALAFAFALILTSVAALAQIGLPFPGPGTAHTTAAGYTGPGDLVSGATAWWGLRAYNAAQADGTHKAINIKRSSDNETCDVFLNTSGQLGNTTACSGADSGISTVSFCNATNCFLIKWYDQTGNSNDALANTSISVATFNPSATIASQAVTWSSGSTGYCTSGTVAMGQTVSTSTVYNRDATGVFNIVVSFDPGTSAAGGGVGANQAVIYAGSAVEVNSVSDASYHAVQSIFAGASSEIYVDGSANTGLSPGAGSSSVAVLCMAGQGTSSVNPMSGKIREVGIWPNAAAASFSGNLSALNSNQHTYWGF